MSLANDLNIVKLQYNSDKNLNSRGALHKQFSTNKYGWSNWVFDQYRIQSSSNIIEFGCGNGAIWQSNKGRIPDSIEITLTDLSEGMLNAARINLKDISQIFNFSVMDIQNITYEDDLFDTIIANHMLYHVPNRSLAIKEVSRVLKPGGTFYATTNGINNMKELKDLVEKFDSRIDYATFSVANEFGLENGAAQLSKCFDSVDMLIYEDSLQITKAQPLVDYVLSLEGHTNVLDIITENRIGDFLAYLEDIISSKGSIEISKSAGMFVAKNPKK
jgi:ubiquinone/menaquinone biosynthesis C-methylase UbiE